MYIYTLHRCCWDCLVCPDPPPPGLPMNQKRAKKTKILPVVPVVNHVFQVADYRITTQIFQIVPFFGASGSDRIWIRHNAKRLGHSYRSTKLEPDIYCTFYNYCTAVPCRLCLWVYCVYCLGEISTEGSASLPLVTLLPFISRPVEHYSM